MKNLKLWLLGFIYFLIAGLIVPFITDTLISQTPYKGIFLLFKGKQMPAATASVIIGTIIALIGLWLGAIIAFYLIKNISLIKEGHTKILFASLVMYIIYDILNLLLTFLAIFKYNQPISYVIPFLLLFIITPILYYYINKKYLNKIVS